MSSVGRDAGQWEGSDAAGEGLGTRSNCISEFTPRREILACVPEETCLGMSPGMF